MKKKMLLVNFLLISLMLITSIAWGAIINVPGDQPTIQAGINVASPGDTVLIADGTYIGADNKNLDFGGKAITVTSVNGAASTIIDCEGSGRGFYFHSGETTSSVVEGLTIKNGSADYGAGIRCDIGSSPMIRNNIITQNTATVSGGGIASFDSALVIENNTISNNNVTTSGGGGGGIYCNNVNLPTIFPIIRGNTISQNTVTGTNTAGGGITCSTSNATIENNEISGNKVVDSGGGIYSVNASPTIRNNNITGNQVTETGNRNGGGIAIVNPSQPMIEDNTISGNSAPNGGGIACGGGASPTIQNNSITNNSAPTGAGGGILGNALNTNPIIQKNLITNNSAYSGGGGIVCGQSASPTIQKNLITNNSVTGTATGTGLGGGIACGLTTHPTITNNAIASNTASRYGGGIACNNTNTTPYPTITNNTLTGNSAVINGAGVALFISGATVLNTILWNGGNEIFNDNILPGGLTVTYSDVQGGYTGEGNINEDPMLSVELVCFPGATYGLSLYSPCIGAGTSTGAPVDDICGDDRPNPPASKPDIGADETELDIPLAVTFASLTATTTTDSVTIKWSTATETNNLGFNIYRSDAKDGKYIKVNARLINGAGSDATSHDYSFTDENLKPGQTYYYYIEDVNFSGKTNRSHIIEVTVGRQSIKIYPPAPLRFALLQNYPNPFNPETWFPHELATDVTVTISIYDVKGQLVRTLHIGLKSAGKYVSKDQAAYWDGKDNLGRKVASGVYFYTMKAGEFQATRQMVILK